MLGKIPCTSYELNDRSKQKKCAVKCQAHIPPVFSKESIKNFKPLSSNKIKNLKKKNQNKAHERNSILCIWYNFDNVRSNNSYMFVCMHG